MSQFSPTRGDVHVNRPLTNISIAYFQSQAGFVADQVFPNIPVQKQSDRYFTYDRGEFNRDEMQERAPGTESAGSSYTIDSTPTYYTPVAAMHKDVPDQIRANADSPLQLDTEATIFVTHKALIRRERLWVGKYFVADVWRFNTVGNATPTAPSSFDPEDATDNKILFWSDAASTPIEDIRAGMTRVQRETGFRPNTLTLGREVYDILVDHPDIVGRLDRGQTNGTATANREAIAALLELDRVIVMDAIYNSEAKRVAATNSATGRQTGVHQFIGGKNAMLSYAAPAPGIMTPSAGYTFSWNGFLGASANGLRIKRFRMEALESDRVEAQQAFDQKMVGPDLGYFFGSIIT